MASRTWIRTLDLLLLELAGAWWRRADELVHGLPEGPEHGLHALAHLATWRGRTTEALDHLDRATALALGGELGILETGIVFCNAIFTCRARGDWGRARTWTETADRFRTGQVCRFEPDPGRPVVWSVDG